MILVVFRGTVETSLENWIHNVMTTRTKVKYPGMPKTAKVHDGFYRSWTRSTLKRGIVKAVRAELHARDAERKMVANDSDCRWTLSWRCSRHLVCH